MNAAEKVAKIICALRTEPMAITALADETGISEPRTSEIVLTLRRAGLVSIHGFHYPKRGRRAYMFGWQA